MDRFEYNCPHCGAELRGSFGDAVYCEKCEKSFETDWEYSGEDSHSAWLTGREADGKTGNFD